MKRRDWNEILEQAAGIVASYDTGVTLRQLFYRLVSPGVLRNTDSEYTSLSHYTAQARQAGTFPDLIDRNRTIHRPLTFRGVNAARSWLQEHYRRDRTEGQPWNIYLGVEKAGIIEQLRSWFDEFGFPILALGGYASQTYTKDVRDDISADGRPAVLIYAGDFDPSGEDIDRDFVERVYGFAKVVRIALNAEQVTEYHLPPMPGKSTDTRAARFVAKHGKLIQVELDALPPDTLRDLYTRAVEEFFDRSIYERVMQQEQAEREQLKTDGYGGVGR